MVETGEEGGSLITAAEAQDLSKKIFAVPAASQMEVYEKLIEILKKPLAEDFFSRFKARAKQPEKWMSAVEKRAYEVARYALGVGTTAYLYHTISALTFRSLASQNSV